MLHPHTIQFHLCLSTLKRLTTKPQDESMTIQQPVHSFGQKNTRAHILSIFHMYMYQGVSKCGPRMYGMYWHRPYIRGPH